MPLRGAVSGTAFAANNNGAFGDLGGTPPGSNAAHPLIWVDGTTTASGSIPASGVLATLTVSTVGISAGSFPLLLTGVVPSLGAFNTDLLNAEGGQVPLSIVNGLFVLATGLTADFNDDMHVNFADFEFWRTGFSVNAGATHLQSQELLRARPRRSRHP